MPHGPFGFEREEHRGPRMERGDLRYVILRLLEDRPSHGYEIIRALEERFGGLYTPSPGTVYPTLQWLQDLGYVTAAEEDSRKVYTITEEGRRFLAARAPKVDEIFERMGGWWNWGPRGGKEFHDDMREMGRQMRDIFRDLKHDARRASPEKMRRVREVVLRASREIEDILRESEPQTDAARPSTPDEPVHL